MSLVVDTISKRFETVKALDGVSFEAQPGRIFGLLGANGAGKTTSTRIVLDILRPDSGSVTWMGTPNVDLPRDTWGYLPEERGLFRRLHRPEHAGRRLDAGRLADPVLQPVPAAGPRHPGQRAPWEWIVAAALMLLVLAGALWVAARIYSAGVLLYGQRPSLRAVMRAVRVDR